MRKIAHRMFAIMLLLLPFCGVELMAQIAAGGVYNLVNQENNQSMSAPSAEVVSSKATDLKDYSQLWYAESATDNSGRFALRNLSNGLYLRSSKKQSGPWTLVTKTDDNCYLYSVKVGEYFVINSTNDTKGYNCMHFDTGQGRVVCWSYDNANKSKWGLTTVNIPQADLEANWKNIEELGSVSNNVGVYQNALNALFVDKACTVLKNPNEDFANNAEFKKLSSELQQMVLKIQKQNWTENNANAAKPKWDHSYAQKFRVQLYEPYSDPVESAKALKINHHSNLNNPTGIYANGHQVLYVMVEGAIKDGASLYLSSVVGHNLPDGDCRKGTQLHEGLNIVTFWSDGNAVHINYVVETFKNGAMTQHKLSQYEPLKIHIEGGHINGYFNVVGDALYQADTNADWQYYEDRANLEDIILLGKYQTIQFYLNDTNGSHGLRYYFPEADVNAVMAEWDRIMMSERLNMGLLSQKEIDEANAKYPTLDDPSRGIYVNIAGEENGFYKDYSDAYRLHGLSFGTTNGYMYGSNEYSGYNVNTFGDIIGNITKAAGPTWGPAHEIGHQHQRLLNMNGLTEVSNNIFSNIAVWYNGRSTSRINVDGGDLMSILNVFNQENTDFFTNDRWALTQMNYKMWLYYHLAGHNNKFYPRLFEILRNDPMQISATQDGATSLLHLYKKCCLAAGEDLTDFFRAYGVFRPMDNRFVDDYTKSHYTMTQAQIDAAIKEVKSWNLPENHVLMLINDATADKTYGHDGKTQRELWSGVCSDLGSYIDFYVGKESKLTVPYVCHMEGNSVHMSGGKGGVGFLIYDRNGELLGFSDHYKFPVSARAQMALAKGNAKLYVANGDNSRVEVKIQNAEANEKQMLVDLLAKAENLMTLEDATGKNVGFYRPEALTDLKTVFAEAKKIADAGVPGSYLSAYEVLNDEVVKLQKNQFAKVGVVAGSAYTLVNRQYTNKWMSIGNDKMLKAEEGNLSEAGKWYLESAGGDGVYAIKSKSANSYVKDAKRSTQLKADQANGEFAYQLKDMGAGYFALICQDHEGLALHCDAYNKIVGWDPSSTASQWLIQAVELSETEATKIALKNLVRQTEDLTAKMAVVKSEVELQTTDANAAGYLWSNAPFKGNNGDKSTPENGYNLLDNNVNTHFHSEYWNNSVDNLDHYLKVDLGEGQAISEFVFHYETRNKDNAGEMPQTIVVEGSNDGTTFASIATINAGLPRTKATLYTSDLLTNGNSYRYLRFMVTATVDNAVCQGHKYFSMASFGIGYGKNKVVSVAAKYQSCLAQIEAAVKEMNAANAVLTSSQDATAIQSVKTALQSAYQALFEAFNEANNTGLSAKKDELHSLMDQVQLLLDECGTLSPGLQVSDPHVVNYLSSNADQNDCGDIHMLDGGGVAALIDGNPSTYFHSRWDGAVVNEPHFVQVDLGQDVKIQDFQFTYTTRQKAPDGNTSPAPTRIKVLGNLSFG